MKKILFVLALVASMQVANAQGQVKSISAAKSAVESAKAAVDNVKKNTKAATWIKYGQALMSAYGAPAGNVWNGMTQQDLALLGGGEKPSSEEQVTIGGAAFVKQVYSSKNLYFDQSGQLAVTEITKPIVDNALDKALEAFAQAGKLDDGKSTKDITAGIKSVADKYVQEAYNCYTLGNAAKASEWFEKAANAAATAPYSQIDTNSIYNAGFTALQAGNNERAKSLLEKCVSYKYYGEEGEAFAKLADIADKLGDKETSKKYLEQGFEMFPQSQGILVGLINYYIANNEDTGRLFDLLNQAKKNEPNNASLYYVEGNIHEKLGNLDEAVAAYDKCAEINPNYEFGFIGKGIHFYNLAVDLQDKAASELNDAKYMALLADFEKALKSCIEPFEKAFEISKDNDVKMSVAEYLKNACFRFRTDETSDFNAKYEKYNKFLSGE